MILNKRNPYFCCQNRYLLFVKLDLEFVIVDNLFGFCLHFFSCQWVWIKASITFVLYVKLKTMNLKLGRKDKGDNLNLDSGLFLGKPYPHYTRKKVIPKTLVAMSFTYEETVRTRLLILWILLHFHLIYSLRVFDFL